MVCEMGLYMNKNQHPALYKTAKDVQAKNQGSYQYDGWTEFLKEQKRANQEFNQAFLILNQLHQNQDRKHEQQWREVGGQIEELRKMNVRREASERFALELLEKIEGQQVNSVDMEEKRNREIADHIDRVYVSNKEMMQRLDQLGMTGEQIEMQVKETEQKLSHQLFELREETMNKIDKQETKQQTINQQMEKQDAHHQEVIERLDRQEAVSEKIIREIQHIRSILFERASFLAEKIENGYKLTSSYLQKFVSNS